MSLIDDLNTINIIKANIKTAIENKGQTVTNFGSYPEAINNIVGSSNNVERVTPTCHIFYNEEDAQNFDEYMLGDKALVYNIGKEPFTLDGLSANRFMGSNTAPYDALYDLHLTFNPEVTLQNPVEIDTGVEWEGTVGTTTKTKSYKFWLTINATECIITMAGFISSANGDMTIKYTSTDGLHYTFENVYDTSGNVSTAVRYAMLNKANLIEKLPEVWADISIVSRFICFAESQILSKIYTYDIDDNEGNLPDITDDIYVPDLIRSTITNDNVHLVAHAPISAQLIDTILNNIGLTQGVVLFTENDYVYVINQEYGYIRCDQNDNILITTAPIEDTSVIKLYRYNLEDNSYIEVAPNGKTYTKSGVTGTLVDCTPNEKVTCLIRESKTTNADTGEINYTFASTSIMFCTITGSALAEQFTTYINIGMSASLKEDFLGLYATSNDITAGKTAFANNYIIGG